MEDDSILNSVKKHLNIDPSIAAFDQILIVDINSVFSILFQLGVGPEDHQFTIEDENTAWSEFTGDNVDIEMVKTYMYLKTRLLFDPPTVASVLTSFENLASEFEWRLNVAVDPSEGA